MGLKATLSRKTNIKQDYEVVVAAAMKSVCCLPESCCFSAFDISVMIPGDWRIRPEHRGRDFTYQNGFIHFEKPSDDNKDSISFGLLWETVDKEEENADFISNYAENMEKQYQKKMKKQEQFTNHGSDIVEISGVPACILRISYNASTELVAMRRAKRIQVTNIAFLQESSRRRITATIIATQQRMEREKDVLEALLYSIRIS